MTVANFSRISSSIDVVHQIVDKQSKVIPFALGPNRDHYLLTTLDSQTTKRCIPPDGFSPTDSSYNETDSTWIYKFESETDSRHVCVVHYNKHFSPTWTKQFKEYHSVFLLTNSSFVAAQKLINGKTEILDEKGKVFYEDNNQFLLSIETVYRINGTPYILWKKGAYDESLVIGSTASPKRILLECPDRNLSGLETYPLMDSKVLVCFNSNGYDNLGYGYWSSAYLVDVESGKIDTLENNSFPIAVQISPSRRKIILVGENANVYDLSNSSMSERFQAPGGQVVFLNGTDFYVVRSDRESHIYNAENTNINNIDFSIEPDQFFLSNDRNYIVGVFDSTKALVWELNNYSLQYKTDMLGEGQLDENVTLDNFVSSNSGNFAMADYGPTFKGLAVSYNPLFLNKKPIDFSFKIEQVIPFTNKDSIITNRDQPSNYVGLNRYCLRDLHYPLNEVAIKPSDITSILKELAGGNLEFIESNGNITIKSADGEHHEIGSFEEILDGWLSSFYIYNGYIYREQADTVTVFSNAGREDCVLDLPRDDYFESIIPLNRFAGYYELTQHMKSSSKLDQMFLQYLSQVIGEDFSDSERVKEFFSSGNEIRFFGSYLFVRSAGSLFLFDTSRQLLIERATVSSSGASFINNGSEIIYMNSLGTLDVFKTDLYVNSFLINGYTIPIESILKIDSL
ncbi:MAG: hypothetical protein QM762_26110 [Chryseolinea sp.]